jgi:UDPglucose--hexose-1-phosphate uridylyltransferase
MIKSEIRKDYLLDKYVIITPGREARPRDIQEKTIIKHNDSCFFCQNGIQEQQKKNKDYVLAEIKENNRPQVTAVKNIFPALSNKNKKAYGYQEVIIETPHHNKDLGSLSEKEIENVLKMYAQRTEDLQKDKKINYILCFKNQGSKAGASIAHAHSQIFASNVLPPDIKNESTLAKQYKDKNKTCFYCDLLKKEAVSNRKIFEDKNVIAFAPYASEYHYEAWIFSKRHLDNITNLNKQEFKSFAKVLKKILLKLKDLNLSFNFFLHQAVSDTDQHFYLKIQPRDSVWAGVELGSGLIINSVAPETAAQYYQK